MSFWTTRELRALGKSDHAIRLAAARGAITPVRRGHWATPDTPEQVLRAARVGGVATATTASRALGLWTPPDPDSSFRRAPGRPDRLHFAVPGTCGRLRDPDDPSVPLTARADVAIHWTAPDLLAGTSRSRLADPLLMAAHVFASQPPERALAVLDSALRARHLRQRDLAALAGIIPAHLRTVLQRADPRSDSGVETIVRFLLRARGLHVETLVDLSRIGEVDLLVEGRLIVECDGREFHDEAAAFERDRGRDLSAARLRYRVLRVTWHQVLFRWEEVKAAVFAALAA